MDAVIKLKPEELTEEFFKHLKLLANASKRIEIKLDGVDTINNLSEEEIDERIKLFSERSTISFTMEEFEEYIHKVAR